MTPICVSCKREMRCSKTGRRVVLTTDGEPYQVLSGDEYACPACKVRVVTGFARGPLAESYMSHFAAFAAEDGAVTVEVG